jgi:chromosome segregation ATPase
MKMSRISIVAVAMFAVVSLTVGCAAPPDAELAKAEAALNQAEQTGAPTYAPDAWNGARDAMSAAKAEVAAQQGKFALLRSYTKAKELVAAAETKATEAEQAGVAAKAQAKTEAEAAVAAVQTALETAKADLASLSACRRKPKGFAQDLEQMNGVLSGLEAQVGEAATALSQEQYLEASSLASSLQGQLESFTSDIASAKKKIRC